ncbi:hypothetical protein SLUN_19450 [Streptomyces lunaelactis]|uniref:Uncharacterized protein n=1 Tax=Streptomyces lunaelactis TaxID=1535768 RepID=A0A2R4T4C6_9ACTN|nr:hypothetical protein [Streptomyces lunaelactis]AVZ74013.1 hypothetical protein SLUN_19450 [Streptomyces lunaelactis]NUK85181.1 hypothetical protein [Streptomyces lunaelactis]
MGKRTVWKRTERDAKELSRIAKVGDVFYTVADVATNLAPYEDAQLYSQHRVEYMHPLLGAPMICGSLSVEGLVLRFGPVYTEQPAGMRGVHQPGPQYAGPLPEGTGFGRDLSDAEIRSLEAQVAGKPRRLRSLLG